MAQHKPFVQAREPSNSAMEEEKEKHPQFREWREPDAAMIANDANFDEKGYAGNLGMRGLNRDKTLKRDVLFKPIFRSFRQYYCHRLE